MKISILLPYKENFSPIYAGAVSLFEKDTTINSNFKNIINVFGHTKYKSTLLKNYINLDIKKSILQSNSRVYVEKFLEHEKHIPSDLIEIHNRPNYVKFLSLNTNSKIILYFHNDPLTMNGSKSLTERRDLLKKTHKLIFNSKWSHDRFMQNFNKFEIPKDKLNVVYQSSKKVKINFNNKKKNYFVCWKVKFC